VQVVKLSLGAAGQSR